MGCIDRRRLALAAILIGLLTGCATAPDTAPETVDASEASAPSALPEGPVTPNPYAQMEVSVSAEARAEFERALDAMQSEQWGEAEQRLLAMTEQYPTLSGPWVNLGKVYAQTGRSDEAVTALEKAVALNPNNLDAYNQLALLKREAGEFEQAEAHYRRALSVWPFHARTHLNLGVLLDLYRGRGQEALLHYRAYQQRQEEMDRQVAGWIVDLERRLAAEEEQ
ncbi:tetratricopeptide repeat protein [Marinimicrobium agarilyticum]|uniref:tetratricopeptide repeat protein n=1 Tax=Marinimicrobium agarilyticum TaxID=306546 RepID=UPI00041E4255|nr:tetratricopeptide repeat protein [Marinimicrobium agarilyticum]